MHHCLFLHDSLHILVREFAGILNEPLIERQKIGVQFFDKKKTKKKMNIDVIVVLTTSNTHQPAHLSPPLCCLHFCFLSYVCFLRCFK